MPVTIVKADGSVEYFKVEKLRRSLRRAGATKDEVREIVTEVDKLLYEGIKTQEIYRLAFELLRKSEMPAAARYSLRRALFGLGPTGFPFEIFLAKLFEVEGYITRTGVELEGKCASHEIDVTAYNETNSFVAEAKFHARPGIKTDLQVVMYSYARLLDLKDIKVCNKDQCGIKDFLVVTNTKFTSTAERYATCTGLKLLSWDYPRRNNLHDHIQRARVYPITVLPEISNNQAATLISHNIILCRDLLAKPHVLRHLHISQKKTESILQSAKSLCQQDN
ncbi:ATPase [Candidatus Kaiserbacteria bacterium]|nr:ATPase [Candidatus Kaiserbacteria bacterium]